MAGPANGAISIVSHTEFGKVDSSRPSSEGKVPRPVFPFKSGSSMRKKNGYRFPAPKGKIHFGPFFLEITISSLSHHHPLFQSRAWDTFDNLPGF